MKAKNYRKKEKENKARKKEYISSVIRFKGEYNFVKAPEVNTVAKSRLGAAAGLTLTSKYNMVY